jgi:hypothetical protein
MGRARTVALIAAAFFAAMLVMYDFDWRMTIGVFVIVPVMLVIGIVHGADIGPPL